MRIHSAARVGSIEEACICVGTKYHVACTVDYAVIRIGSIIVEWEVHCLLCGNSGIGLADSNGAERHKKFVINRSCIVEQ